MRASVLLVSLAGFLLAAGCGQAWGRVRRPDGTVGRRRLDAWEALVARSARHDLPCEPDGVIVARVHGSPTVTAEGCGNVATYRCADVRGTALCELDRIAPASAARMSPLVFAPPQAIVAMGPSATGSAPPRAAAPPPAPAAPPSAEAAAPPSRRGRARSELGDPRGP